MLNAQRTWTWVPLAFIAMVALTQACSGSDSGSGSQGDSGNEGEGGGDIEDGAPIDDDSSISGPGGPDGGGSKDVGSGGGDGADGGGQDVTVGECIPGAAGFECPCAENGDCESGFCIDTPTGAVCTQTCLDVCPDGYACKGVLNLIPDVVFVCVPEVFRLCNPCTSDQQCGDGRCIAIGDGEYCTSDCSEDACPPGYLCQENPDVVAGGGFAKQCVPDTATCDCTPQTAGNTRSCSTTTQWGECFGIETCDPLLGWTGCTAVEAAPEECNGADDDCNGIVDNGLPNGEACENAIEGVGACQGIRTCLGPLGWVCNAPSPSEEVCDFQDNNCNGAIDELFTSADGTYGLYDHCGTCNKSCGQGFPNATTKCDGAKEPPQCVVVACDEGYFKLNEFQCVPTATALCQACLTDSDCLFEGAKCLELADGKFCGKSCQGDGDCPAGYGCSDFQGALQCQPDSGTCSCDGTNTNLQKGCSVTYVDPSDPNAPTYTCTGMQACLASGWGSCELPYDACDNLDNDCDGLIDEDFVDANGRYFTNEHCGHCGINCGALSFENGSGVCDSTPIIPECILVCDETFSDVNQNPADGCECPWGGQLDMPDGTDQNCDGVDGEILNAIFVAKDGNDANTGEIGDPVLTIGAALELAAAFGKRDIYVATGVYQESFTLKVGIGVYGGYASNFLTRNILLYETVVVGQAPTLSQPGAVNAIGLNGSAAQPAIFDGFTVFGFDNKVPSGNSYAIYLRNCSNQVKISNNTVYAGDGGSGLPGSAGQDGADGVAGTSGGNATDSGTALCLASTAGGQGGAKVCGGVSVSGGGGGTSICPDYDETGSGLVSEPYVQTQTPAEQGKSGAGPQGGQGGTSGYDFIVLLSQQNCSACIIPPNNSAWNGSDGVTGGKGADGQSDPGCTTAGGAVQNGHWAGGSGKPGAGGQAGSGGGGGGAGGGVEVDPACYFSNAQFSDRGGSGGGGGSGACPGTGGGGGGAGGGSFGIFVTWNQPPASPPVISGNALRGGVGGAGGPGGPGGVGGIGGNGSPGGKGGASQPNAFCAAQGGYGGRGGDGGQGGGGGGGCGGVSFGIYADGMGAVNLAPWKGGNSYLLGGAGGQGGFGGASLGQSGGAGSTGVVANTNF